MSVKREIANTVTDMFENDRILPFTLFEPIDTIDHDMIQKASKNASLNAVSSVFLPFKSEIEKQIKDITTGLHPIIGEHNREFADFLAGYEFSEEQMQRIVIEYMKEEMEGAE